MDQNLFFIATKSETNVAIMGALGFLSVSLLLWKIVRYFIGVGMFGVFFFSFYLVSDNLETSMFLAIAVAIIGAIAYEHCIKNDLYFLALFMILATIGFIIILVLFFNLYRFNVSVNKGGAKPTSLPPRQKMKEALSYFNKKF